MEGTITKGCGKNLPGIYICIRFMRFSAYIVYSLLLTCLFSALSSTPALACGGSKGCCKKETAKTVRKTCCNTSEQTGCDFCKTHKGCKGNCSGKSCPCSHSTNSGFQAFLTQGVFVCPLPEDPSFTKADWYFLNKIPAAVYLSIALPPKIGMDHPFDSQ